MIYLDNSATTRPFDSVIKAVAQSMGENFGNASSLHTMGINAEKAIKTAKKELLNAFGAEGEIYFTSGATESNNTAIFGVPTAYRHSGRRIVTTSFEHPSVENPMKKLEESGYEIIRTAPPKRNEPQDFEQRIIDAVDDSTLMVSVMWVNNETGFISDISKIYRGVKRKNPKTIVHCDAVQGLCKLDSRMLDADIISASAHKINGPKGVGALFVKKNIRFEPLLYGGGQQKGLRSGTEPVSLITGFGVAAAEYKASGAANRYAQLNEKLIKMLSQLDDIAINSYNNSKNILNFSVRGKKRDPAALSGGTRYLCFERLCLLKG